MLRRTHAVAGLAAGLFTGYSLGEPIAGILVFGLVTEIAALLPDQDIRLGIPHRTLTHSLVGLAVMAGGACFISPLYGEAVLIGYSSHLMLDMLTPHGIPLLWPLELRFRLAKFRTGGYVDALLYISASCMAICAILLMLKVSI